MQKYTCKYRPQYGNLAESSFCVYMTILFCFVGGQSQEETTQRNAWKKSHLQFDGVKFVLPDDKSQESEESDLRLDYDLNLQESLHFYLDSEFLGYGSNVADSIAAAVQASDKNPDDNQRDVLSNNSENVDLQNEFMDINEASQRLILESLAPSSDLLEESAESGEESKVIEGLDKEKDSGFKSMLTHPLTADNVYTQISESPSSLHVGSSSGSSNETVAKADAATSNSATKAHVQSFATQVKHIPVLPKISHQLSVLGDCTEKGSLVNIIFVVLQINATREIQIKSGLNAGQYVPLSSMLVADESKSYFKLTLWREASAWTEKILPGEFIVATSIQIGNWRSENVGQTTYRSNFYNLHQPKKPLSREWCQLVSQERLNQLILWTRQSHPYLFSSAQAKKEVVFKEIAELEDSMLVHFRGVLTAVTILSKVEGMYTFGNEQLPKIVLSKYGVCCASLCP